MPFDHLLRHVLLVPIGCGLGVALLLLAFGRERWPAWSGLAWAAAAGAALLASTTFATALPPRSAEEALPVAALFFALAALWRLPGPESGWGRLMRDTAVLLAPSFVVAWLTAFPVREYHGWGAVEFPLRLALFTLIGAFSGALHRAVARQHPAPGPLAAWMVLCVGAAIALLFGRLAKGLEFAAIFAASLGPILVVALWRGRAVRAEALAAPFAGGIYAILLLGWLQGDMIWISAALLALLAPAAGLLRLRSTRLATLLGALVLVTALPAAAAAFLSFMKASVAASHGGGL